MLSSLFKRIQEHITTTPGAFTQLAVCVAIFLIVYLFSRLLRYKICPWLIKKSELREKKGFFMRPASALRFII